MAENGLNGAVPPYVSMLQLLTGYWASQALSAAAKLGIADLLADGPRSLEDLAEASHAHAPSLNRLLRALVTVGVFAETSPGTYALTPLAAFLQKDTPDSLRAPAIMYSEEQYRAWGDLLHSIQTGEPAFDRMFGTNYFTYLGQHPESDRVFNEAMTGWTTQFYSAVLDVYDFSPFQTIVDVGGSYGSLLAAVLRCTPAAKGILFDQPHVAAAAKDHLAAAGVTERCSAVGGDFFTEIPAGGDAYLLAQILHDWDDERSISILRQCRRAILEHGKLLVFELVLPSGDEPSISKCLDLHMLVLTQGGRERTAAEYDALFRAAGFALERVIPTSAPQCILEAVAI